MTMENNTAATIQNEKDITTDKEYFTDLGYSADDATELAKYADIYSDVGTAVSEIKPSNKRRRKHKSGYAVSDEILLCRIIDSGFIDKLHGVKADVSPRVYYFDKHPDIKVLIDEYNADPDNKSSYMAGIKELDIRVKELESNMKTILDVVDIVNIVKNDEGTMPSFTESVTKCV